MEYVRVRFQVLTLKPRYQEQHALVVASKDLLARTNWKEVLNK